MVDIRSAHVGPLKRYQDWLRSSPTCARWLDGWALVIAIGAPMAGGWALTHVLVGFLGIGESGLPVWVLVWSVLVLPLYLAATIPLRLIAGRIDDRRAQRGNK